MSCKKACRDWVLSWTCTFESTHCVSLLATKDWTVGVQEPSHFCPTQDLSNRQHLLGNSPPAWVRLAQNGITVQLFLSNPSAPHHVRAASWWSLTSWASSIFDLHRCFPNKPLAYLIPSLCLFLTGPKANTDDIGSGILGPTQIHLEGQELPFLSWMQDTQSPRHKEMAQFLKISAVVFWGSVLVWRLRHLKDMGRTTPTKTMELASYYYAVSMTYREIMGAFSNLTELQSSQTFKCSATACLLCSRQGPGWENGDPESYPTDGRIWVNTPEILVLQVPNSQSLQSSPSLCNKS